MTFEHTCLLLIFAAIVLGVTVAAAKPVAVWIGNKLADMLGGSERF